MRRAERYDLIKRLQGSDLRGQPFDLSDLASLAISPQLAAKYIHGGWLERLGRGVYSFPGCTLDVYRTVRWLEARVPGLHIGGKSALALQGIRHNLGARPRLVLWGDTAAKLPSWFLDRFPSRYVGAHLFSWPNFGMARSSLTEPPEVVAPVSVAVPERAVLELLYEVGRGEGLEEAHNLFEGIRSLRLEIIGRLLTCCTNVKTVRLFLTWARETTVVDVAALQRRYRLPTGSDKRWMTRMKDGTLLTLKPHG